MRKLLLLTGFLFALAGNGRAQLFDVSGGIHTNAVRDSVQLTFIMLSTDAKTDTTADSVVFLRHRVDGSADGVFVDRTQTTVDTFNLANHAGDIGSFTKVVRASDGSGTVGTYFVLARAYKSGSALRQHGVASYQVFDSFPGTWTGVSRPIFAVKSTDTVRSDGRLHLGTAYATPTVAGVPEVDVTHHNGTAVVTPLVAGAPVVTLHAQERESLRTSFPFASEANLVRNPSFEKANLGWIVSGGTTPARKAYSATEPGTGLYYLGMNGNASNPSAFSDTIRLLVGHRVRFGGKIRTVDGNADATTERAMIALVRLPSTIVDSVTAEVASDGEWYGMAKPFKIATAGNHAVRLLLNSSSSIDSAAFDDIFLEVETPVFAGAAGDSMAFVDSTAKAPRTHTSVTTVTGNVNGSVGSVTGAVGSVTGNVGGNVVGSVGSVTGAVGSVTAAVTVGTNNDKTNYTLTAADKDLLADVILVRRRGTVGAGSTTGKIISTNFIGLNDDDIANNIIVFLPGATTNRFRTAYVTRFFNTGDSAVIRPLLSNTPAAGDSFAVIGIMGKTVTSDSTQAQGSISTTPDTVLDARILKRVVWGIPQGSGSESTTVAQRVVTASGGVTVSFHSGTGNRTVTITTVDSAGGFPAVSGALVTLIDSTSHNVAGHLPSNVSGITTFTVNDGGYYIKTSKTGYRPIYGSVPSPQDSIYLRVSGNTTRTDTIEGAAQILPVVAGKTNVYGYVQDILGDTIVQGVEIEVRYAGSGAGIKCCTGDTSIVMVGRFTAITRPNDNGRWEFNLYPSTKLIPNTQYQFTFRKGTTTYLVKTVTVPDQANWRFQY